MYQTHSAVTTAHLHVNSISRQRIIEFEEGLAAFFLEESIIAIEELVQNKAERWAAPRKQKRCECRSNAARDG